MREYAISIADISEGKYIIPHKNKAKVLTAETSFEDIRVDVKERKDISFIVLAGAGEETIKTALSSLNKDDVIVFKAEEKTSSKGKIYLHVDIKTADIEPLKYMTLEDYNNLSEYLLEKGSFHFQKLTKQSYLSLLLREAYLNLKLSSKRQLKENKEESVNVVKPDKDAVRKEILRVREELLKNTTKTRSPLIRLALSNLIAGNNVLGVFGGTGIGKTDTILKTILAFYNQDELLYITCGHFTKPENLGIHNKYNFLKKKVALFENLPDIREDNVLSNIISLFSPHREVEGEGEGERFKSNIQAIFWTGGNIPDLEEAGYRTSQIFDRTNILYNIPEPSKEEVYEILLKNLDRDNHTKKLSDESVILRARELSNGVSISKAIVDDLANFIVSLSKEVPDCYRPSPRKVAGIIDISKVLSFLNGKETVDPKIVLFLLKEATLHPFVRDKFNSGIVKNTVAMLKLEEGKAKEDDIEYLEHISSLLNDDILKEKLKTKLKK